MGTWSVNSYSYPNPFRSSATAQDSWEMLQSFAERSSYDAVKQFWDENPPRRVRPHAVESWKATFEEFGLLYVVSGTGAIVITPAGRQILAAAEADDEKEFAWIGLNLLLRYPLRGEAGRRPRDEEHADSDLLPYWFLHAALIELDGFWQQEFFRVLSHVFRRSAAVGGVEIVQHLRAGTKDIKSYPDPSSGKSGRVYNALNQVFVHGSLNHMLFTSSRQGSRYFDGEKENWWYLRTEYSGLVELALGGPASPVPNGCGAQSTLMKRMPEAPRFTDEGEYFDYVGARVLSFAEAERRSAGSAAPAVEYGGEMVFLLTQHLHFTRIDETHIVGSIQTLCVLGTGQRVLVSDNSESTYIVSTKLLMGSDVEVVLRRARPITDAAYVEQLFEGSES